MHSDQAEREDPAVDRVLRGLDAVQPAVGFEERLLQGLAQRSQKPEQHARHLGFSMRGALAGAGCFAALLVMLFSLHFRPRRPNSPLRGRTLARLPSPASHVGAGSTEPLAKVTEKATQPREGLNSASPQLVVHAHLETAASPGRVASESADEVASSRDFERQALDDLHAESVSAPPLPPTAQERMVRLMLRRGEKHDLAQLDPSQSVRLTDAERRSFQTFFDPDPSPELALELKKGNLR